MTNQERINYRTAVIRMYLAAIQNKKFKYKDSDDLELLARLKEILELFKDFRD